MSLTDIEKLLSKKIGVDCKIIGSRKIAKAVENRCSACSISDLKKYLQLLQTSPEEFTELVEQIVVPETYFFRDRKSFDFLINFVKTQWLTKSGHGTLRLLSVPCSTGEEPYSIAIALMEAGLSPSQFRIDAIDISKQAIAKAQQGIYGKNSFRGEVLVDRNRYFQQTAEKYEISPSVRNAVNFKEGNLINTFFNVQLKYDVIFCRNLLIYLEDSACTEVLKTLNRLLLPNGLLFVGAAETAKVPNNLFTSIRQPFTAYRKKAEGTISKSLHHPPIENRQVENIGGAKKQNSQTKKVSSETSSISYSLDQVAGMAQATATSANHSQDELSKMEAVMRQLTEATISISSKLGVMNNKASNINNVVVTITKVADQTSILSLNAAIEAEKAGEYGAGFAVVAREIRRLANQTAVATLEIEQIVKDMQSAVTVGVMEMDKFNKSVSNSVERVSKISYQVAEVINKVQSLPPRFEQVSQSIEEQSEGAQQISEAMGQLSQASEQTVDALRETNNALEQLDDAARGLRHSISSRN